MTPDWDQIASEVIGTSGWYDHSYLEELGIELDEFRAKLAEHNAVTCECCGWWVAKDECSYNESGEEVCEDCQETED